MEYNTERTGLVIPEYGRHVQKMVEHALTIEDRAKRTAYANLIVNVMTHVNPDAKNIVDYKHKLWDHLFIISDYKLDVDSPFPMPDKTVHQSAPDRLEYKNSKIAFRPYGNAIEQMINKVIAMEDGEEKEVLIELIAQQLKKSYLQWNRDSVDDELILKHFDELSQGQLKLQESFKLNTTRNILNSNKKKNTSNPKNNNNQKRIKASGSKFVKFNRNQK